MSARYHHWSLRGISKLHIIQAYFFKVLFNIILSSKPRSTGFSSLQIWVDNTVCISSLSLTRYKSHPLIVSAKYLAKTTDHDAPNSTKFMQNATYSAVGNVTRNVSYLLQGTSTSSHCLESDRSERKRLHQVYLPMICCGSINRSN